MNAVQQELFGRAAGAQMAASLARDVCRGRHGGNAESEAAHMRVISRKAKHRIQILQAIARKGKAGASCKELATMWGVGMNHISGRFTELKEDGRIVRAVDEAGRPVTRDGSSVWVVR